MRPSRASSIGDLKDQESLKSVLGMMSIIIAIEHRRWTESKLGHQNFLEKHHLKKLNVRYKSDGQAHHL